MARVKQGGLALASLMICLSLLYLSLTSGSLLLVPSGNLAGRRTLELRFAAGSSSDQTPKKVAGSLPESAIKPQADAEGEGELDSRREPPSAIERGAVNAA